MRHSIGARLTASFALLLLMMAAMRAVSVVALRTMQQRYAGLVDGLVPAREQALRLEGMMYHMASDLRSFVLYGDEGYLKSYERSVTQTEQIVEAMHQLQLEAAETEELKRLEELVFHYSLVTNSMTRLATTGAAETGVWTLKRGEPTLAEFTTLVHQFQTRVDGRIAAAHQKVAAWQLRPDRWPQAGLTSRPGSGVGRMSWPTWAMPSARWSSRCGMRCA